MKNIIALLITVFAVFGVSAKDIDLTKINLNYEQKIVAMTILAEARGEGNIGMYAVACIIQTRAKERKMTLVEVCFAPSQFSCWNGKGSIAEKMQAKKQLFDCAQAEYAGQLARVLWQRSPLDNRVIGNANHYHTTDVKPKWSKGKKEVALIGNHKFFRL